MPTCQHSKNPSQCKRCRDAAPTTQAVAVEPTERPTERQVRYAVALCRQQPGVFGTVTAEAVSAFERSLRTGTRAEASEAIDRLAEVH